MTGLPADYAGRVYAGVLGKIIGVYLGRPFEGWSHERIEQELGEVDRYVHDRFDQPLVVTDDDIAGTFTFLRALEDNAYDPDLTPAQIGDAWLNYLIENRTVLWWGGLGVSTEHTAYLRLKSGIRAPESGSIARNGTTIAEQIGAQIFIDGWAMLYPGDPEKAVDIAGRAARVSHDGEAVYGAQVIAALEAMAFVEHDLDALLDTAVSLISPDSTIARVIADIREWHARDRGWRDTLRRIQDRYGYDRYPGACHMVPNHAVIINALLHGGGDFQRSLMIVNTSGWDTDCNSGNVGAILGIRNGLAGIDGSEVDWRGPVADRMYLSTADGGRAVTDAATEAIRVVNAGRALHGVSPIAPKGGARFHFSLPGSVQGFQADDSSALAVENDGGKLALTLLGNGSAVTTTPVFLPPEAREMRGYHLYASPTLHTSHVVSATVSASTTNASDVSVTPLARIYSDNDEVLTVEGSATGLAPGHEAMLEWSVPNTTGMPVLSFGFRVEGHGGDAVLVDRIDWDGAPTVELGRPEAANTMWRRAWADGVDQWETTPTKPFVLTQNAGTGLISQGTERWRDYRASVKVSIPLARSAGIAARVGGMRRYLGLVLEDDGFARLIRMDGERAVLAETPFVAEPEREYALSIRVRGTLIEGRIGKDIVLAAKIEGQMLAGGVGLVVTEGTMAAGPVVIEGL